MKQTLSVKNWDEFQHYKDRNPPWIKLHNTLLEDYDFESLQDASKGHLLCIWMLASRTGNKIPYDANWIGRKIGASDPVDLDGLVGAGFLVVNQQVQEAERDASKPLADCKQSAIPEERRGEGEEKAKRKRFTPPTQPEVFSYMLEKGLGNTLANIESNKFWNHYDSNGWKVGRTKMVKWKSSVSGWLNRMDKPAKAQQQVLVR
jgi:hypothetical protein